MEKVAYIRVGTSYFNKDDITRETSTGRFYTVKRDFLLENFDELMRE